MKSMSDVVIKNLIDQVGTDIGGKWVSIDQAYTLARLVAKECAGIANGSDQPAKEIKDYFGVEL